MNIKILKNEYLFSKDGYHICDENGFATMAQEDCEILVEDKQAERVLSIIKKDRENRGLDENGNFVQKMQNEQNIESEINITE